LEWGEGEGVSNASLPRLAIAYAGSDSGNVAALDIITRLDRSDADARALWATRVLMQANLNGHHISFPYPHQRGGYEMIDTPELRPRNDVLHHGDTPELCIIINAADAVFPGLPEAVRQQLGEKP
jgi:hypothetical protein